MTNTKKLVLLSLLTALTVVLARFVSIKSDIVRISFEFLPILLASIMFGPLAGGITAAVADLVGALLFPHGAFFPGFTFSAFLSGIIYGLFLYKKKITWFNAGAAVLAKLIVVDMFLVSLWLITVFRYAPGAILVPRVIKFAVMLPIEFIFTYFVARPLVDRLRKVPSFNQ